MEFGAANAYKRIDDKVEMTLKEAAEVLKLLKVRKDEQSMLSVRSSSSYESRKTISIGATHHSVEQQPRATIRTPKDAMKNRKISFPEAEINIKSSSSMVSASTTAVTDVSSIDPVTPTPDSLFPNAIYIPAGTKKNKVNVVIGSSASSRESVRAVKTTGHRCHVQKLGVEPLEDIKQLKCRGLPKSKPDSDFPKATYECGSGKILTISPVTSSIVSTEKSSCIPTTDTTTCSHDFKPMEFVSADGRLKMMLQPLEEKKKKKESKKVDAPIVHCEESPIVPKQLQSSTKLKTYDHQRTKFSANFALGDLKIDLSGMFNGNSMNKADLTKLVINGKSYST